MKIVLFLIIFVHGSYGVIYRLNDSMYARMPPLHKMDNYEGCLENSTNRYCLVHFTLVSDEPSDLLYMIQEYSMKETTRLNYTHLRYGMCLKHKCDIYEGDKSITSRDHLETCLNDTFSKNYGLKTVITDLTCNTLQQERFINLDMGDVAVATAIFLILALNIIGSLYDAFTLNEKHQDQKFLSCFSIRQNWKLLTSYSDFGDNMRQFQILYSIRSLIIIGVISSHVLLPFLLIGRETKGMEDTYLNPIEAMFLSGPLLIQTYFVMSGFLLGYKIQLYLKKNNVNVFFLPRLIFFRWLRLTPPYALLLAFMATWLRFFKTGPFWEITAGVEIADCRNRWWYNLLYINNYISHSQCMPHSWYIAADMQLSILGVIVCLLLRHIKRPIWILLPLFLVGLLIPAVHTYLQDLDPMLLLKPTGCSTFFDSDKTYNEVYKRGHTNLVSFIIGLSTGYVLVKICKTKEASIQKYKKYFFLLWFIIPIGAVFMYIGGAVFYRDAPRDSIYVRTIFAMISRPLMGFLAGFFILGMILKIESLKSNGDTLKERSMIRNWRHQAKDFLRVVLNWNCWLIPGRLSYCVYLIHFPIIRITTSVITTLIPSSPLYIIAALSVLTIVCFVVAVPISLLVEIPFMRLIKEGSRKTPTIGDGMTTRL